jgi:hypothetical protein
VKLRYISQDLLVGQAGGDPWAIDNSLQHGRPGQIADLAQAFHNASQCTTEADNAFVQARQRFESSWNRETGEHPINDSAEVQRATKSLGVQAAQLPKIAVDLENIAATLAEAQRTSTTLISTLNNQLQQIDTEIGQAVELEKNPHLTADEYDQLDEYITELEDDAINNTKATLQQAQTIRNIYSDYLQKSLTNLRTDNGYDPAPIQAVDAPEAIGDAEAERRHNQTDAFTHIFGRAPTSATDWDTAAALDPHSYDPKYNGVAPEIRVVKIRPVPGQGVVRVSQWIEQRDVTAIPPRRDFGDNRTANPNFNPENARVTTYIDYENGIVVMRQNPSVQQDGSGKPGQVMVGAPQGSVTQTGDGAVRVKYDAGNPFAPEISKNPPGLGDHPWTVNGDLVFSPGSGGVHVDGTRTNYPSMEVYQDLPNGSTRTVLVDPARAGSSLGPLENLPRHHEIGIGGRAFEPFDREGWNPRYDVRAPLPFTDFGSVSNPPSVQPRTPSTATLS